MLESAPLKEALTYDLNTADGLLNRAHNLYTDADRVDAYRAGKLGPPRKNVSGAHTMYIHNLNLNRMVLRVLFRFLTINGIIVKVFNAFASNIGIVFLLVFNTLLTTVINGMYFGYSGQSDLAADIFAKVPVQFGIIFAASIAFELIGMFVKLLYHRYKTYLTIMRRIRFDYIVKQMRALDPGANTHEYEYDSELDDPDVAISVLRNNLRITPDVNGRYCLAKIRKFFCGEAHLVRVLDKP